MTMIKCFIVSSSFNIFSTFINRTTSIHIVCVCVCVCLVWNLRAYLRKKLDINHNSSISTYAKPSSPLPHELYRIDLQVLNISWQALAVNLQINGSLIKVKNLFSSDNKLKSVTDCETKIYNCVS